MTEQELRIEFQRISEENNYLQMLNEDDAVDLCKFYADARESKEIAELKAGLSQAQQMYTDLLVGTTDAIAAKDSEIKRLTCAVHAANVGTITMGEAIERAAFDRGVHYARVTEWTPETTEKNDSFLGIINDARKKFRESMELVLSPAPVTEAKNEEKQ